MNQMKIISFKNILSKYLFLSLVEIFLLLTKSEAVIFGLATLSRRPATLLKMLFHVDVFLENLQNVQRSYSEEKKVLICYHFSVFLDSFMPKIVQVNHCV